MEPAGARDLHTAESELTWGHIVTSAVEDAGTGPDPNNVAD